MIQTALEYFDAACRYGDKKLREACIKWFLVNLMTYYYASPVTLKVIPPPLMKELVANPDLFVMQTEFSIYVMLKYWMYMIIHVPQEDPSTKEISKYFCSRKGKDCDVLEKMT